MNSTTPTPNHDTLSLRRVAIDTYHENVAFINRNCELYRAEGFQALSKIEVIANGQRILAVLNIVDDDAIVTPEELGLSEQAFEQLAQEAGHHVHIEHSEPPQSMDAVRRKIEGQRLTLKDFCAITSDISHNRYSKMEMAAFLVASMHTGLDREEILYLTRAMIETGEKISWGDSLIADKHCIGGVPGNRTSMLIVPIIAITWIVIAEGVTDEVVVTITAIGLAAIIGGIGLTFLIIYRERVALRIGEIGQRWYNGLAGGKWKFPEAEGLGVKLVDFRAQAIGVVRSRWFPALVVTLTAQAVFFLMLVMSMRFMGVTADQASVSIIFDAYAVGLLLSMIPIFPGGLGVVELAYVGVIVGTSGNSELAAAVTAGAFVHRIFSWLLPIVIGLIPLAAWRRKMVKDSAAGSQPEGSASA